jgi:hypothetical protein
MAGAINSDGEVADLTTELLDDATRLTHPDCHPPERQELAHRVTQELLALRPFAFAKPQPKIVARGPEPEPRNSSVKEPVGTAKKPLRYPCRDCADTIPYCYCDACMAEWNKRQKAERDRQAAQQRKRYAERKAAREYRRKPTICPSCGAGFKGKRADARFCSPACRQKADRHGPAVPPMHGRRCLVRKAARLQRGATGARD